MANRIRFVIGLNAGGVGAALGVKPAGAQAGVDAALDIRSQAVAHHDGLVRVKVGDLGDAQIEKGLGRLIGAQSFGDEGFFDIGVQA